jgi:hypothetical protein
MRFAKANGYAGVAAPDALRSLPESPGHGSRFAGRLAVFLELAAGTGLAYLAGFGKVRALLASFQWPWLTGLFGALFISFAGYYYAYWGIFHVDGGPALPAKRLRAVVAAGFGGFLAHGGGALDQYALEAAGADRQDAKARVSALAGLEHGVLAIGGTATAIAVLALGRSLPPMDFSIPWAVIPVPVSWWRSGWRSVTGPGSAGGPGGEATWGRSSTPSTSSGNCSYGPGAGGQPWPGWPCSGLRTRSPAGRD